MIEIGGSKPLRTERRHDQQFVGHVLSEMAFPFSWSRRLLRPDFCPAGLIHRRPHIAGSNLEGDYTESRRVRSGGSAWG